MSTRPAVTYLEAIQAALEEEMARDASVFVLRHQETNHYQADVADADRIVALSQSAAASVDIAVGAALMGMRPVIELRDSAQLAAAIEQIRQAAGLHALSRGMLHVPLVIRAPVLTRARGGALRAHNPETWLTHLPGVKVVVPSTPYDAKGLLKAAIRDNNPVVYLEQRYLYHRLREELPPDDYVVPVGQAEVRRLGVHLTILTYGAMVYHAIEAAQTLAREDGIVAEVVDLRSLAPLDLATVRHSLENTNKALIVHEDSRYGGPGAEIAASLAEHFFAALDGPILRVAAPDLPYPQFADLEASYLPDAAAILTAARKLASY